MEVVTCSKSIPTTPPSLLSSSSSSLYHCYRCCCCWAVVRRESFSSRTVDNNVCAKYTKISVTIIRASLFALISFQIFPTFRSCSHFVPSFIHSIVPFVWINLFATHRVRAYSHRRWFSFFMRHSFCSTQGMYRQNSIHWIDDFSPQPVHTLIHHIYKKSVAVKFCVKHHKWHNLYCCRRKHNKSQQKHINNVCFYLRDWRKEKKAKQTHEKRQIAVLTHSRARKEMEWNEQKEKLFPIARHILSSD